MNRLNTIILQNASIHSVGGFREGKGPRPARSYRNARRNLARALRSTVASLTWPSAWVLAQKTTYQSLQPSPKGVEDPSKLVRTIENGEVGLAPRSEVEGSPDTFEAFARPSDPKPEDYPEASEDGAGSPPVPPVEAPAAAPEKPKKSASALSDEDLQAAVNIRAAHPSEVKAAEAAGLSRNAFRNRLARAAERGLVAMTPTPVVLS